MTIENKINLFLDEKLEVDGFLSEPELKNQGVLTKISFLRNVFFEKNSALHSMAITGIRGSVFIGANSYVNAGGYMREKVFIGRYCSIGRRVSLGAGMHHYTGLSTSPAVRGVKCRSYDVSEEIQIGAAGNKSAFTIIENDVWIGDGVVVVPGVRIGNGAIIGANTVVTKDVPPYAIVAGMPQKIIRYRFPADIVNQLIEMHWHEYDKDIINSFPCSNIFEFIEHFETVQNNRSDFKTFGYESN